ncbi:hypothetical protein C5S35_13300 [Candidatus Methanophagaceae archaeon]|nr:hypothetical protein C5S35_13300 [Methanophagales archaeon]
MINRIVLLEEEPAKDNYEKSLIGNHDLYVCIGDIGQSMAIHEVVKV